MSAWRRSPPAPEGGRHEVPLADWRQFLSAQFKVETPNGLTGPGGPIVVVKSSAAPGSMNVLVRTYSVPCTVAFAESWTSR